MNTPPTSGSPPSGAPVVREPSARTGTLLPFALLLAFASGAAALVYEVAWTRRALLVVGSTSAASAIVLAAFLGGLGVGGRLGGPIADRAKRPLALYGALECAAALWAAAFPWIVAALEAAYVAIAPSAGEAVRFPLRLLVAAIAVAPGALALGATYPALLAAVARAGSKPGPAAAWIYGVNTAGAVAGALWCGFTGIFSLGVSGAMRAAAAIAAIAGLVALVAARGGGARDAPPLVPERSDDAARATFPRGALVSAFLGGVVGLGLQAAGSRALVFFVEGFTASFAAMLAVFLAGLAAGSLLLGPWLARRARPAIAVGALFVAAGAVVLVESGSIGALDGLMRDVFRRAYAGDADPRAGQRWMALAGASAAFALPAFLLGATYPLAVAWASRGDRAWAGTAAGRVAIWNTVGAVLGPLLVLLLGRVGAEGASPGGPLLAWTLCGVLALAGGAAILLVGLKPPLARVFVLANALAVAVFVLPGLVARASPETLVASSQVMRAARPDGPYRLLAVRSDDVTTASVVATPAGERILYTDDFAAAATGRDYPYMRLLGHLPVLGAASPRRALVIAFGTGTTAGAVATHAEVERLEVVDTSRAVLSLAPWFEGSNARVLATGRAVVRADDGRHALLVHEKDLDVVTLEPLLPTTPAALPFYTREFYDLARSRVVDGGVVCQWVPVHAMPLEIYASCLRTFFEAFPDSSLWFFEQSSVLVGHVGSRRPTPEDVARRAAEAARSLRAAGFSDPSLLAFGWVASGKRVLAALDAAPPGPRSKEVVTDDRPSLEAWPAPRGVPYAVHPTLSWLASLAAADEDPASAPEMAVLPASRRAAARTATREALLGRADEAMGHALRAQGFVADAVLRFESAERRYADALRALGDGERSLVRRRVRVERLRLSILAAAAIAQSDARREEGKPSEAAERADAAVVLAQRAWSLDAGDATGTEKPFAAHVLASALLRRGRCAAARDVLQGGLRAWPWDRALADLLAAVDARRGVADGPAPSAAARRVVDASPPCVEPAVAPVRQELDALRAALALGREADAEAASKSLLARVAATGVSPRDVAAEVSGAPVAGAPAIDVARDALLRALDPGDPALRDDLASDDPARWRAALRATGRFGFERLASREAVAEHGAQSADEARRLAFVEAAVADGSAWSLERLADLLLDPAARVRAAAWAGLSARLEAGARASAGYDPDGDDASRRAAAARVRAALAPR